ncbi:unnamed protein product [Polarella glacialis]|uniref:Uncharacterized protein n=1 Tax=Polarella glacialis TaxID=89957 RepID=A0A813EJ41_POLGL|nr:unnamed protein product [Polarella glacialis]
MDAIRKQHALAKAHTTVELALQQWERGDAKGLVSEVFREWQRLMAAIRKQHALAASSEKTKTDILPSPSNC